MNKEQLTKKFECVDKVHDPLGYGEHSTVAQRYKSQEEIQLSFSTYAEEKKKTRDNDFTVSLFLSPKISLTKNLV